MRVIIAATLLIVIFSGPYRQYQTNVLIMECEAELSRDQECKIIAVPALDKGSDV